MTSVPYPAHESNPSCITIPMSRGRTTLIGIEDSDLAQFKWWVEKGYVERNLYPGGKRQRIRLHRIVLERKLGRPIAEGFVTDHINGNPLDNRRENLREVTQAQNVHNQAKYIHGENPFKGVRQVYAQRWEARINDEHIGTYRTAEEASLAYDKAALAQWGEYARLTNPLEEVEAWQLPVRRLDGKNTLGFRGVRRANQPGNKWTALITHQHVSYCMSTYDTIEEAARAYDRKAIELKGEKALLNFPRSDYEK